MDKISVIIPTYKPNYYIWECLNSLKFQTLSKNLFEVLIILNGDKEPYYSEILEYINKNNLDNFSLIYIEKNGVSNARNIGLDNCKGNYIAFIDDDDYISENYFKNFYEILGEDILFIANLENFYEKNRKLKEKISYKENERSNNFIKYRQLFSYIGAKIIPMNIIKDIRFNSKYKNGEDSLFMAKISKNIKLIKTSKMDTIYWRRIRYNSANFGKKNLKYIFFNSFSLINEYLKLFFRQGYDKKFILIKILAIIKGGLLQIKIKRG